jgi:hypothetical protein
MAAPAAAQTYYPQPQQTYPGYPQQGYPAPGYGQPGYGQQGGIAGVIQQLLGGRYQRNDQTAITQCASAASAQAAHQYRPRNAYGQQAYNSPYMARVTAITNVARTRNGLRVTGMMDSGMGYAGQAYTGQQGYDPRYAQGGDPRYQQYNQYGQPVAMAAQGDLTFRCNVDYRGQVTNIRINRNRTAYRR